VDEEGEKYVCSKEASLGVAEHVGSDLFTVSRYTLKNFFKPDKY
jgi:hypothetical protein